MISVNVRVARTFGFGGPRNANAMSAGDMGGGGRGPGGGGGGRGGEGGPRGGTTANNRRIEFQTRFTF
jgi:hypothetical protein